jgi:putative serine protease PepD
MSGAESKTGGNTGNTRFWALAVIALLVAGLIGGLIANALNGSSSSTASAGVCNVVQVAADKLPSVVTIRVASAGGGGVGSGEVIRSDGYILTNDHVISPAANGGAVKVQFYDGKTVSATITGRDPLTDLAVLKVDESDLPVIAIGDSSDLKIGQPVVALGAPLGLYSTVTSGIVSALGRTVTVPGEANTALLIDAIQTDAAINPGNSGGALVDCSGQLVGVPTAGASVPNPAGGGSSGSVGLGFAIPVNFAIQVADEIISTGTVTHAYLGVRAQPVSPSAARENGIAEGLFVVAVAPNGPVASAGLMPGDVITKIDGEAAVSTDQIMGLTLTKRAGDKVELTYDRDGTEHTATVTLTAQPAATPTS